MPFKEQKTTVSIIVLNWNGRGMLADCFDSLRKQTFKGFEVIMVDNGSSDDSIEYVRHHYPEVQIVELDDNLGFSAGNNAGIRLARGEYIALLNNDAVPDPAWLEIVLKEFERDKSVGFCASKIVFESKPLIDSAGDIYTTGGFAHKLGHLKPAGNTHNLKIRVFGACAAASIYRRSMLDDIGLLDEEYFHSYEDVDLSFRAQLMGYRCLYVPEAVVRHKVSASSKEGSDFYVFYGQRNVERAFLVNMPFNLLAKYSLLHLFYMFAAYIYFAFKGKGRTFLKAKYAALRSLPSILARRREVQSKRRITSSQLDNMLAKNWIMMKREKFIRHE